MNQAANPPERKVGVMTEQKIAEVCHEANRAFCATQGDNSQLPWAKASQDLKDSVIDGVQFHLANPGAAASQSHNNWLKKKKEDGWKYGDKKDEDKKEHPCFVPYDVLPAAQRVKDQLFINVLQALKVLLP